MDRQLSVRLPAETIAEVERLARSEKRSVSNLIRLALEQWIDDRQSPGRERSAA